MISIIIIKYRTLSLSIMNLYSFMVLKAPIVPSNNNNFIIASYFSSGTPFFIRIPSAFAEEVITILPGAQDHKTTIFGYYLLSY
jgi:hypothetical protein